MSFYLPQMHLVIVKCRRSNDARVAVTKIATVSDCWMSEIRRDFLAFFTKVIVWETQHVRATVHARAE